MKSILTFLLLFALTTSHGQPISCGFDGHTQAVYYAPDEQRNYAAYLNKAAPGSGKSLFTITHSVKLKIWMIYTDNGGGLGPSSPIYQAIQDANQNYFAAGGIEFVVCQEEAVNSSLYHDLDVETELNGLKSTYYQNGVINVYITNSVTFGGGMVGGVGYGVGFGTDLTALSYAAASNADSDILFGHELGHCLHLAHTHGKFNWLPADCNPAYNNTGLNDDVWCQGAVILDNNPSIDNNNDQIPDCMQTGDDICDTHAEPQLGLPGMVSNCLYTGTATDPNGSLYNPVVGNIMSYTPGIGNCSPFFTAEQYARMVFALDHYGLHLFCSSCAGTPPSTIVVYSHANAGLGSLRWAIACANNYTTPDTIAFSNALGANPINLTTPLPDLKSNLMIRGGNATVAKTTINGLGLTNQYANGLTLAGNDITLKKIIIADMPLKGIVGWNACEDILIDSCEMLGSGRLFSPYGNGAVFLNSTGVSVKNSRILSSKGNGMEFDVNDLTLENNVIGNSDYNGVVIFGNSSGIQIMGNRIGADTDATPLPNLYSGIVLVDTSSNIQIGGLTPASGNVIANQTYTGIVLVENSYDCNIGINTMHCNGFGIYVEAGSNNNVAIPTVDYITSSVQITGTCPVNSEINVYKSKGNCAACEGFQYLGSVASAGAGWLLNLPVALSNGDKITATATVSGNTSQFAWCQQFTCSSPPGCCLVPVYANACSSGDYTDNFSFGAFSKFNTGCANPGASNYSNYTGMGPSVQLGETYQAVIGAGPKPQYFGIYIDFNQNGSYLDAGEFFNAGLAAANSSTTFNVTIPSSALKGTATMRVRSSYSGALTAADGCETTLDFGETEDYSIYLFCPNNLAVNSLPIPSATYSADVEITSLGIVSGGAGVIFQAGTSVALQPGFEVQWGGVFEVMMQSCFP